MAYFEINSRGFCVIFQQECKTRATRATRALAIFILNKTA